MGDGHDAFRFAQATFHAAAVLAHRVIASTERLRGEAERIGEVVGVLALRTRPPVRRFSGHSASQEAKASALRKAVFICGPVPNGLSGLDGAGAFLALALAFAHCREGTGLLESLDEVSAGATAEVGRTVS